MQEHTDLPVSFFVFLSEQNGSINQKCAEIFYLHVVLKGETENRGLFDRKFKIVKLEFGDFGDSNANGRRKIARMCIRNLVKVMHFYKIVYIP